MWARVWQQSDPDVRSVCSKGHSFCSKVPELQGEKLMTLAQSNVYEPTLGKYLQLAMFLALCKAIQTP